MPCTETVQGIFCFSEEKPQKSAAAEPEPKLGERRPDMLFDGLDADVEPLGDLPVFQACRAAQQEHLYSLQLKIIQILQMKARIIYVQ